MSAAREPATEAARNHFMVGEAVEVETSEGTESAIIRKVYNPVPNVKRAVMQCEGCEQLLDVVHDRVEVIG